MLILMFFLLSKSLIMFLFLFKTAKCNAVLFKFDFECYSHMISNFIINNILFKHGYLLLNFYLLIEV